MNFFEVTNLSKKLSPWKITLDQIKTKKLYFTCVDPICISILQDVLGQFMLVRLPDPVTLGRDPDSETGLGGMQTQMQIPGDL
jgi:hypothetical protein